MSFFHPIKERPDGRKVRYAAVGAGWITQEDFLPGVAHTGNSVLAALVTGDPAKAEEIAAKYDIPHTTDYAGFDALLHSGDIDAIYLATPNTLHRDFAVPALEAGIHVLCEKPMAPTEEDCRAMIDAAKRGNAKLMIAYRLHFEEGNIAAIEAVQGGKIGEPRIFSSVFCQQVSGANHRAEGALWAGPLPDMGPYPINAVRHLFAAEPTEAFAFAHRRPEPRFAEIDEMITVVLRFPGQRVAQFTVSYGANSFGKYTVAGTKGTLEVDPGYGWDKERTLRLTIGEEDPEETSYDMVDEFGGETLYFSNCILDDCDPEPDGWEGLADVRVIKAIEESVRTGQPQKIEALPPRPQRPNREQLVSLRAVEAGELVHAAPPEGGG